MIEIQLKQSFIATKELKKAKENKPQFLGAIVKYGPIVQETHQKSE
jgi:hypothetical protein